MVDEGEGAKSNLGCSPDSGRKPQPKKNQHVTYALLVSVKTVTAAARRDPLPVYCLATSVATQSNFLRESRTEKL